MEMRRETPSCKEKESIVEDREELVQEKGSTPNMEKIVSPPFKEYV